MDYFLCVLGMVMVVEGLPYFAAPDKMKQYLQVILELDDASLRLIGGLLMGAGLLIVVLARGALE